MTSRYHTAMFTESAILDALGAGDELVSTVEGLCSVTERIIPTVCKSKFVPDLKTRIGTEGHVRVIMDEPIKLQKVFDDVHRIFPSFTIQRLSLIRFREEYSSYTMKNEVMPTRLEYKTWGFKPGTFKRWGAAISPGQIVHEKFSKLKKTLKNQVPPEVYRRAKDCVLLNSNPLTHKQIVNIFLDVPYILILEERQGDFILTDFEEIKG